MNITAGKFKGQKIAAPDANIVRPTLSKAREAIFSVLYSLINFEGKSFLDMFAGSGIMGLEALSRGFESTLALEQNAKVARILKENYQKLGVNANLIIGNSLKTLTKTDKKFDVIYIDPPYLSGIYEKCLDIISEKSILKENGIIILEHICEIDWEKYDYQLIKQKEYSKKIITFLNIKD